MLRRYTIAAALLTVPTIAHAQADPRYDPRGHNNATSRPSVDCSLLTPTQALGLTCAAPSDMRISAPPLTSVTTDASCDVLNPYGDAAEVARVIACTTHASPDDQTPAFIIGQVYSYGYSEIRAIILGLTRDTDGVQVVTLRWLQDGQSLAAVRTPPTPGGVTQWTRVQGVQ